MEINSLNSTFRKRVAVVQTVVEQKIEPEADVNIGKILCVNAKAYLENVEVLNLEAYYSGEVVFDAVFTDEHGNLISQTVSADLQGKIQDETLNASMYPIYKVEVVNVSINNASASSIRVNATIEITLDCLVNDVIYPYNAESDNLKTKQEMVNLFDVKTNGTSSFSVDGEFEIKGNVSKQLIKNCSACIKDVKSGTGYFSVEGELYANVCYETGEDDNKMVKTVCECIPFKEEVEVDGLLKEDKVELMVNLKPSDITMEFTSVDEAKTMVNVKALVGVKYFALQTSEHEITVDVYCTTNNINLVSESFSYTKNIQSVYACKDVDCELNLQEDQKRISKILFTCGESATVTNSFIEEDKLTIEGIAQTNVIYLSDDDIEEVCSVVVENPFKLEIQEDVLESDNIFVRTNIKECTCRAKKGKELMLDFSICIKADIYLTNNGSYVKQVEIGEEYKKNEYSLQLFFAKEGEDVWSIGKKLHISPETITSQNPTLTFPLEKPEQIVYFIQK